MANETGSEQLKSAKNHKINNGIEREKPSMREVAVALSQTKDWKMAAKERRKKQKKIRRKNEKGRRADNLYLLKGHLQQGFQYLNSHQLEGYPGASA